MLNVFTSCYLNQWFCIFGYVSVSTLDLLGPGQHNMLGKPLHKKSAVQTEFVQIAFQPLSPQANGRFVGAIFAENLSIF